MTFYEFLAFATFLASELRASSPYKTGNMQRSIATVVVDDNAIDVVIAVDYASYVNDKGKHKEWVERVVNRCSRCYFQNNVDDTSMKTGIRYEVIKNMV